jgi:hypothetical protein
MRAKLEKFPQRTFDVPHLSAPPQTVSQLCRQSQIGLVSSESLRRDTLIYLVISGELLSAPTPFKEVSNISKIVADWNLKQVTTVASEIGFRPEHF